MSGHGPSRAATSQIATAVSAMCPYLRSLDGTWRSSTPTRDHRCTAVSPPAILATDKQRRLCLTAEHVDCSTYMAAASARAAAAGSMVGRGPRRPMPTTTPVALDHGRLAVALPGMSERSVGQGGLVALLAVAFGALAVSRLTGGPELTPAAGGAGSGVPSVVGSVLPAETTRPTTAPTDPTGPTRTLVPSDVQPTPTATGAAPSAGASSYTVQSGDTLSKIAAAHGTTWQRLAALNKIKDPKKIHVGQVLQLP